MEREKNFEWLTLEICNEYKARADKLPQNNGTDTDEWRKLREELQHRCNIGEVEAFNILRGRNVRDYLQIYGMRSGDIPTMEILKKRDKKAKTEYEEKLEQLETRMAELELLARQSAYGFEERD